MDDLYLQILLIFVAILFAGILTGLIICSLGDDTPAEAMCGWCIHPPRKRRTTIGPNGEVVSLDEASTESYDGPPLDPVSRSKEKREPMSYELADWHPTAAVPPPADSHSHRHGSAGSGGSGGAPGAHHHHGQHHGHHGHHDHH